MTHWPRHRHRRHGRGRVQSHVHTALVCAYASEEYVHTEERPLYGAARARGVERGAAGGDGYTLGRFVHWGASTVRRAFVLAHSSASQGEGEAEGGG